jgi:hypothetical protein
MKKAADAPICEKLGAPARPLARANDADRGAKVGVGFKGFSSVLFYIGDFPPRPKQIVGARKHSGCWSVWDTGHALRGS